MRNLKRALSLALASVMLLGMMVVGTSAASYPDVDENDNVEAIEVLNAVNVMIGRQGNFEPDEAVNRHEMAVIMAKLVLGVEIADNYVGTHPFTDVVPWADKYVAACYENGLIYGTSATTYGGGQPLTAVQAAAMMLRALGYKDLNKGYQGDWRAPITAMANQIRLFSGVASNPNERLNRNQVAQLALNTLKSPMVNLKDNTISWSNDEGQIIMTGGSREYIVLSSKEAYAQAINNVESSGTSASMIGGYTVELGEHLYNGKLKLNDVTDVFGRPAREWEYDGKVIGDYIKEELMVMDKVGKVTGLDLYNLIGKATLDKYDLTVSVDGISDYEVYDRIPNAVEDHKSNSCVIFNKTDLNRNNKATIGATGTGVLTQVFVDHQTNDIYVAIINTYLARATKAYDTKKEEATVEVYALDKETKTGMYGKTGSAYDKKSTYSESFALGNEDFALVKDIAKDDPFLVTVADGAIQTIVPAEVLSDTTISAFKKGDYVVSGGTQYDYTTTADYNYEDLYFYTSEDNVAVNLKDITYNIFLDQYGNLIGLEANEKPNNYVFLTSIDLNGSNISNRTATANAIFLDGTVETISINMNKSTWRDNRVWNQPSAFNGHEGDALLNTWATYSKSGDVYTIKEVWNVDEPDGDKNPMNDFGEAYRAPKATVKDSEGNYNDTKLAQFRDVIGKFSDRTEITLKNGLRMYGGYSTNDKTSYSNVYGDSSSVYLTAEMSQVKDGDGTVYGVIKGVETVHNGIDGTSITIWDQDNAYDEAKKDLKIAGMEKENVAYGVYTLYNDKGIVIAAMIVGEGSSSSELVYVTSSDAKLESDNGGSAKAAGDGLYTWTREVVRNGEKIDLTEVGDVIDEISARNMKQNEWYQVKTDGNGNVVKAEPAFSALDYYEYEGEDLGRSAFTSDYEHINHVVEKTGVSTVVYHEDNGPAISMVEDNHNVYPCDHKGFYAKDELEVKGNNVLAVNTKTGSGIYFRNDVNVVLVYWNRNTNNTDVMLGEGVEDLKDMVDYVNENSKAAIARDGDRYAREDGTGTTYFLSALIENGAATTIVIQDRFNPYASGDHVDKPAGDQILTLGGIFNNTYETKNNSDVYLVSGRETTRLESIDDLGTATVNGFKRYEVRGGDRIRVLDKDLDKDFIPYFSPVNTNNAYNFKLYADGVYATNPYIEFTMPKNSDLIVRQWQVGDEFPISIKGDVTVKRGTTVLKDGDAVKMGQELTITFDATKVDVKLNGTAIASGDTYTVKATDYALSIVATDKGTTEPDKEYTVTYPEHTAVYVVEGSTYTLIPSGGKVKTGATIQVDPIEVLDVTGATLDADGEGTVTGDVTVTAKSNAKWNLGWNMWRITLDDLGNYDLIPFTPRESASALSARAAVPPVGTDITNEGATWVETLKADKGAVYEQKAGDVTWTITVKETGAIQIRVKGTYTKDQIDKAFEKMDAGEHSVIKIKAAEPTEPTDPAELPKSYIDKVSGGVVITWYSAKAADTKPTEDRIKSEAGRLLGKTITAVDLATNKIFYADGNEVVTYERYYKVTVDGVENYVKTGTSNAELDATSGWKYFLKDTVAGAAVGAGTGNVLSVTDGKVTVATVSGDLNYVRAVAIAEQGTITMTRVMPDKTTGSITPTSDVAGGALMYVPVGVELTLSKAGVSDGKEITFSVANKNGTAEIAKVKNETGATAAVITKYTIKPEEVGPSYKIGFTAVEKALILNFNGMEVTLDSSGQSGLTRGTALKVNVPEGYYIPIKKGANATSNVFVDPSAEIITVAKVGGVLKATGTLTSTVLSGIPNDYVGADGVLKLMPAVKLTTKDATTTTAYTDKNSVVSYVSITGTTTKQNLSDSKAVYATKDAALNIGLADKNIKAKDVAGYSVNKSAVAKVPAGATVGTLAGSASGKIEIVFSLMNENAKPAVAAKAEDVAKLPTAATSGKLAGPNLGPTDASAITQTVTASGNKITVVKGMSAAELNAAAETDPTNADAGKILGLTLAGWGFEDANKEGKGYVLLAFAAPEGVKALTATGITDAIDNTGKVHIRVPGVTTEADYAVDAYDAVNGVAYILFQYNKGVSPDHIFTITWNMADNSKITCEYVVEFD